MKKFLNNPWTISLGATLFGFLLTIGRDVIKGIEILSTITAICSYVIEKVGLFFNYEVKVRCIILFVIICFVALLLRKKYINYRDSKRLNPPDFFSEYTSDILQGVHWEWYWKRDSFGDPHIEGLTPVCPNCKTPLVQSYEHYMNFVCPRCNYEHKKQFPDETQIETLICDNVKRRMLKWASENVKAGGKNET